MFARKWEGEFAVHYKDGRTILCNQYPMAVATDGEAAQRIVAALATFDQAVPSGVDGLVEKLERRLRAEQGRNGLHPYALGVAKVAEEAISALRTALSPVPASASDAELIARLRAVRDWWRAPGLYAEQAADRLEALTQAVPASASDAELLNDIAEMMGEFVDNWPQPKKVSTALKLIAKTMRAALDPEPVTCPRAARLGSPLRYCDDCPEGDLCELPRQALTQQQTSKGEGA